MVIQYLKNKSISKHSTFKKLSSVSPLQKIFLISMDTADIPYFCARGVGVLTMSSSVLGSYVAVVSISTALLPAMCNDRFHFGGFELGNVCKLNVIQKFILP